MTPNPTKAYIGDGVYARFIENGMLRLSTEREVEHVLYFEPEVWHDLLRYVEQTAPNRFHKDR